MEWSGEEWKGKVFYFGHHPNERHHQMPLSIKRRTFLGSVVAVTGWLCTRPAASRDQPPRKESLRWEWEVGEWKTGGGLNGLREWRACVDLSEADVSGMRDSVTGVNDRLFCGVKWGHIQIIAFAWRRLPRHLARCTVVLMERTMWIDGVQPYKQTNLHDIFPGEHTIKETGGTT